MGLSLFKNCGTNNEAPAPNPDPSRWELIDKVELDRGHVLKVRYKDCSNYEGMKLMVFRGKYEERSYLDPHFDDIDSAPIARFRPDAEGWKFAIALANSL